MAFEIYLSISKPVLQLAALAAIVSVGAYVALEIKNEKEVQEPAFHEVIN